MNKKIFLFSLISIFVLAACNTIQTEETLSSEKIVSSQEITQAKEDLLTDNEVPRTILLNAKRWEYDQEEIRLKQGESVILRVNNIDTLHGIAIPDMKLVGDDEIEVDTSKSGEFEFRCANYCGDGHEDMVGKIIIE